MLCGSPPFGGKNDTEIMQNARKGKVSFAGDGWKGVSEHAKDFVKDLMIFS
jgi:calcium-dependent protein kinase